MKYLKPKAPPAPVPTGIHAGLIKKDEKARERFMSLAIETMVRIQKFAGYEDQLVVRLEAAVTLAELPEELASRAWVWMCVNSATKGVYN